jgi:hypothetical protein
MKKVFSAVAAVYLGAALSAQAANHDHHRLNHRQLALLPGLLCPRSLRLGHRSIFRGSVPLTAEFRLLGTSSAEGITARIYATDAMGNVPTTELALATLPGVGKRRGKWGSGDGDLETKTTLAPGNYFHQPISGREHFLALCGSAGRDDDPDGSPRQWHLDLGRRAVPSAQPHHRGQVGPAAVHRLGCAGLSGARVATLYSGASTTPEWW